MHPLRAVEPTEMTSATVDDLKLPLTAMGRARSRLPKCSKIRFSDPKHFRMLKQENTLGSTLPVAGCHLVPWG